jgi:hypothetical protein
MSARQMPLRLSTGRKPRQIAFRFTASAPGHCLLCSGTGWRQVNSDGDRRVTRCECRVERKLDQAQVVPIADRKSAAAGGDR